MEGSHYRSQQGFCLKCIGRVQGEGGSPNHGLRDRHHVEAVRDFFHSWVLRLWVRDTAHPRWAEETGSVLVSGWCSYDSTGWREVGFTYFSPFITVCQYTFYGGRASGLQPVLVVHEGLDPSR